MEELIEDSEEGQRLRFLENEIHKTNLKLMEGTKAWNETRFEHDSHEDDNRHRWDHKEEVQLDPGHAEEGAVDVQQPAGEPREPNQEAGIQFMCKLPIFLNFS